MYRDNIEISRKYKSRKWQKIRKQKLILQPLCQRCIKNNIHTSAYFVHHIEYITDKNYEDDSVFYNIDNLESLCKKCHNEEHFASKEEYIFDENGDLIKN